MHRRHVLLGFLSLATSSFILPKVFGNPPTLAEKIEKIQKSKTEWKQLLTPAQFHVLREEGTEAPFTSPLNKEKRQGTYKCAACELPLFTSEMKFDSGTGWPSFFTALEGHVETKRDFSLGMPRTEYHCTRCGGHQGHVFTDGPQPTGQRWCNNGVALQFVPETRKENK